MGIEGKEEVGSAGPEDRRDEDMFRVKPVGQGAEDDARYDVPQLVDGKYGARHGIVHAPFLDEKGEYGGIVDEDQHDEALGEAEGEKPAGYFGHAGGPFDCIDFWTPLL